MLPWLKGMVTMHFLNQTLTKNIKHLGTKKHYLFIVKWVSVSSFSWATGTRQPIFLFSSLCNKYEFESCHFVTRAANSDSVFVLIRKICDMINIDLLLQVGLMTYLPWASTSIKSSNNVCFVSNRYRRFIEDIMVTEAPSHFSRLYNFLCTYSKISK